MHGSPGDDHESPHEDDSDPPDEGDSGSAHGDSHGSPGEAGHGPPHEDDHGPPLGIGHGPAHEDGHGPPHDDGPGPPHEDGHGPPHQAPPGGGFLVNDERRRSVDQIGEFLASIGSELKSSGQTEMGGQTIRPSESPFFVVRYEQMPKGERKLRFEIEWDPRLSPESTEASGDFVGEKLSTGAESDAGGPDGADDSTG